MLFSFSKISACCNPAVSATIANIRGFEEATSLIWIHTAETVSRFRFDNDCVINHGRFKEEHIVKEALYSGPLSVNR